jgi:allantoinase
MTPIETLNALPPEDFAEALKPLFETAPPLAAALYSSRPIASYAGLIDRAEAIAQRLPETEQIEVVNAHPRIGGSALGMSAVSAREQGASAEADAELTRLNAEYEARHGFRFVVFVNKRPRGVIREVLRERLPNSREQELRTALSEMFAIARDRLKTLTPN